MITTLSDASISILLGRLTPIDLLEQCLAQIDRWEDQVHAWVLVEREQAREQAEELTAELRQGKNRGPLHGIPVGIKDIIDVFDWPTAAGSKLWSQSIARQDAVVVKRLRQAGAVILGKTVTTPFAFFDPSVTRNPWNLERTPGGSSSGSAAAVACGMCLGALGSQTGGSITRPASYCGVAGCKPTFGRVSVEGVVPLAPSLDHVGPIARCVLDLAILLQAIADPTPSSTTPKRFQPIFHLQDLDALQASPPRLGRLRGMFDDMADPEVREMMDRVVAKFRDRGAQVTDLALPADFGEANAGFRTLCAAEAGLFHHVRLQRHSDDYPRHMRALIEEGLSIDAEDYDRRQEQKARLAQEMLAYFPGVDVFLTPATRGPAPDLTTTGDPAFNSPWSYLGFPTVSFPTGCTKDGMPLAIQLVGKPRGEADLIAKASWCEAALGTATWIEPVFHSARQN